jgi:NADH-ubiquinone oxidoreductase chain 1
MILGPIGQKWVCAAGVERSTLHRCGLTGLGLINSFKKMALVGNFSGPGSIDKWKS